MSETNLRAVGKVLDICVLGQQVEELGLVIFLVVCELLLVFYYHELPEM